MDDTVVKMLRRPATKILLTRADVDAYEERNPIVNGEPIMAQSERRQTSGPDAASGLESYGEDPERREQTQGEREPSEPSAAQVERRARILGPSRPDRSASGAVGPTSVNIQR